MVGPTQLQIMEWAQANGARIVKRPQPRALSVVFLDWKGKEVNVLTETSGLPPPAEAFQEARLFHLEKHGDLSVLLVDPYDLLRCKLAVNRPKRLSESSSVGPRPSEKAPGKEGRRGDLAEPIVEEARHSIAPSQPAEARRGLRIASMDRPHQEVLRRFLEEEVVSAFQGETEPRDRIAPAQRLLEVLGSRRLPADLARRLLPHARTASDFRFLLGRAPDQEFEDAVLQAVPEALGLREELERIQKRLRG